MRLQLNGLVQFDPLDPVEPTEIRLHRLKEARIAFGTLQI